MPLANSNGPRWIRAQNAAVDQRLRGIEPIRAFLARLFRRTPESPTVGERPAAAGPERLGAPASPMPVKGPADAVVQPDRRA
jgi:hypothetical protein